MQVGGGSASILRGLDTYGILWPQSWAFFTGLADKDALVAYRVGADGTVTSPIDQRASQGGLNRSADALALAIRQLAGTIPQRYWHSCPSVASVCQVIIAEAREFTLRDRWPVLSICGRLAVAAQRSAPPGRQAGREWVAVVRLTCSG
jgi:hypothetical protein